jgi:hypothetical protein
MFLVPIAYSQLRSSAKNITVSEYNLPVVSCGCDASLPTVSKTILIIELGFLCRPAVSA